MVESFWFVFLICGESWDRKLTIAKRPPLRKQIGGWLLLLCIQHILMFYICAFAYPYIILQVQVTCTLRKCIDLFATSDTAHHFPASEAAHEWPQKKWTAGTSKVKPHLSILWVTLSFEKNGSTEIYWVWSSRNSTNISANKGRRAKQSNTTLPKGLARGVIGVYPSFKFT